MKDKFWIYGHFILIILPLLYLHHYGMIQFLHGLSNTPLFKILGVKDSLSLNFDELRDNEREICEREIHQMVFNLCSSCRFICILLTSICKFNLLTLNHLLLTCRDQAQTGGNTGSSQDYDFRNEYSS